MDILKYLFVFFYLFLYLYVFEVDMSKKTVTFHYDSDLYWVFKNVLSKNHLTLKEAGIKFVNELIAKDQDIEFAKKHKSENSDQITWNEFKRKSGLDQV